MITGASHTSLYTVLQATYFDRRGGEVLAEMTRISNGPIGASADNSG